MSDMNLLNVRGHNLCASGFMLGIVCRSIQTLCAFRECLPSVVDKLASVYAAAVPESNRPLPTHRCSHLREKLFCASIRNVHLHKRHVVDHHWYHHGTAQFTCNQRSESSQLFKPHG